MGRVLLVLLVIVTSLVYGSDLNNHESKKLIDKAIDVILSGDFEKYNSVAEIEREGFFYNNGKEVNLEKSLDNYYAWTVLLEPTILKSGIKNSIEYKVNEVVEKEDKSLFEIDIKYKNIDTFKEDMIVKIKLSIDTKGKNSLWSIDDEISRLISEYILENTGDFNGYLEK